jgi:hypothetical protein
MRIFASFVCLLLTGCVRAPSVSASDAAAIETAAIALMAHADLRTIPSNEWPKQIQALGAENVHVAPEGLYIATSSFFVQEAGLFVPREAATFSPTSSGDPEYNLEHGHVFSYRIRG